MKMEYRYLGHSGLKVSTLSLGGWVTFGAQVPLGKVYNLSTHKAREALSIPPLSTRL